MRNLGRQGLGDGKALLKRTEGRVGPNQEERKEKLNKVDATERVCLKWRQKVLAKNRKAFVGRPSNPFINRAQVQWRALRKLTDFEVPRHLLQYSII